MNLSIDVIQEVTELNLEIHGGRWRHGIARGGRSWWRDRFIWSHLAGDSVQWLKIAGRARPHGGALSRP